MKQRNGWHASLDAMWKGYKKRRRKAKLSIQEMQALVAASSVVPTICPEGLPLDYITPLVDPDSPFHTGRRCK